MNPPSDAPSAIGRYRIDGLLGRGAMGVVYRAYDPEIDRLVAIKLVRADLLGGESREQYLQRFRREAQATGRFSHPNIVGLHDVSADADGNPFLVMEYVHGTSLDRLMANRQVFDAGQATVVGLQVLDALACAHGLGVVHRDIKPANILLLDAAQPALCVKVTDFGISRIVTIDLTQVGMVIGTPSYMSPEQCLGDEVGPQSDLFSVASVLYEMLSGRKAFADTDIGRLTLKLVKEPPAPISGVSPRLRAVLDRAHAKRPEERFASALAQPASPRSHPTVPRRARAMSSGCSPPMLVRSPGIWCSERWDRLDRRTRSQNRSLQPSRIRCNVRHSCIGREMRCAVRRGRSRIADRREPRSGCRPRAPSLPRAASGLRGIWPGISGRSPRFW